MENQEETQQLAHKIFLLKHPDVQDIEKVSLKEDVFAAVKANHMVPLYETLVADGVLAIDQGLLDTMRTENDEELKKLEEKKLRMRPIIIRNVWGFNLVEEMGYINQALADNYRFIGIDTDFPGTSFRPPIVSDSAIDTYPWMKANVDVINIAQLGLALSNSKGDLPNLGSQHYSYCWQFHFCDFYNYNPISPLVLAMRGIDTQMLMTHGMRSLDFARAFFNSGLAQAESALTWVTSHGGYHFGFMVKILTQNSLPSDPSLFMKDLVRLFGNKVYDIEYMMILSQGWHGGLDRLANALGLQRLAIPHNHQAGCDSLLMVQTFCKLLENDMFRGDDGNKRLAASESMLYGLHHHK